MSRSTCTVHHHHDGSATMDAERPHSSKQSVFLPPHKRAVTLTPGHRGDGMSVKRPARELMMDEKVKKSKKSALAFMMRAKKKRHSKQNPPVMQVQPLLARIRRREGPGYPPALLQVQATAAGSR